jgi:Ala-tRNA(Pro) deacylase
MKVYDLLEELSIPYIRIDHDAVHTIEECHDVDNVLGIDMCKNLFLCNTQKTKFYLLMMPGHKKFETRNFCKQINSPRLSFAPEEYMETYLGLSAGSVSVLGLMNDHENHVQLVIDQDVADKPLLGCHPCINTSSLCLSTQDVLGKFLPYTGHEAMYVNL